MIGAFKGVTRRLSAPVWYGLLMFAPPLLSSCSSYAPVLLELPLNRMESPEPMPGVASVGNGVGEANYLILTRDQRTQAPNPDSPEVGDNPNPDLDVDPLETGYFRGDVRIFPKVELGLRKSYDDLLMGQVKFLLAGAPPGRAKAGQGSAALSLGFGHDENEFNDSDGGGSYRTQLDRDVFDAALIFGRRVSRWLLFYGGGYYNRHRYDGEYVVDHSGGTPDTRTALDGEAQVRGLNVGLNFNFGTPWAGGVFECARARIDAGSQRDYRGTCSLGFKVQLGVDPR
jgi:hypothetical protein